MTTTVVVKANHGWPVRVTKLNPKDGQEMPGQSVTVEKGTEQSISVHSTCDLLIHEIQPDEIEQPPSAA